MTRPRLPHVLARLLVTLASISCLFEWLWAFVIGLPLLIRSGVLDFVSAPPQQTPVTMTPVEPSPLAWVFVTVVMVGMLALTVIALIRLPRTIAGASQKIVTQTTDAIIPIVTHHHVVPAKKRYVLSRRITLVIQLLLSMLPLIPCWVLPPPEGLSRSIIVATALLLTSFSMLCFTLAWFIAPATPSTSRTRSRAFRG